MSQQQVTIIEHQPVTGQDIGQRTAMLAVQLGYEGSLSVGALEDEIRFYQRRSVEDVLELGKRLLILKEMTPHGEFTNRIELLGFSTRLAQKFMQAARKFCKSENFSHLKALSSINQGKFLELVVLDDDEIGELVEGGSIFDIQLDDIDCMTASELKKALRRAKSDNEAKEVLIQKKDEKINQLDTDLTRIKNPTADIQQSEQHRLETEGLAQLQQAGHSLIVAVLQFQQQINAIQDMAVEHGIGALHEPIEQCVQFTYQRIAQVSVDLGVQVDFAEMVSPAWMQPTGMTDTTGEV